ncbi:MAG: hypothetical protein ACJ746_31460 [Bryobacteraceae bacterium]
MTPALAVTERQSVPLALPLVQIVRVNREGATPNPRFVAVIDRPDHFPFVGGEAGEQS